MAKRHTRRNRRDFGRVALPLGGFVLRILQDLGCDHEYTVDTAGKPGELECRARPGDPASRFAVEYLFKHLLSKFDDGKSSDEKQAVALEKFFMAEQQCALTNERFRLNDFGPFQTGFNVRSVLYTAQRKIADLLGDFSWDEVMRHRAFTSGASVKLPRRRGTAPYKYSSKLEVTAGTLPLAENLLRFSPLWKECMEDCHGETPFHHVMGNRVITVPKNYKTDRTIAAEPTANLYLQKGVGAIIRSRLKRVRIDLDSQETNQDLALLGAVTDGFATIDLSMASDTVSRGVVTALLPPDWVEGLEQLRSPVGVLPSGAKVLYRKFSSMGNAYTFELETLIFWALASSVCRLLGVSERLIGVYGDDIVVPSAAAAPLISVLQQCGFSPNEDKTFVSGPFRESCGKHFFNGNDVTPFYVRRPVKRLPDLFLLHNNLRRWLLRVKPLLSQVQVENIRHTLGWIRSFAPSSWRRPRIPDGFGDGAFIGTFDECLPSKPVAARQLGWEGWYCQVLVEQNVTADFFEEGYGFWRGKEFNPVRGGPDPMGRLLAALDKPSRECHSSWDDYLRDSVDAGIPTGVRTRIIDIIVPQFPTVI